MKERPILFSGLEVRAILAGTKTQARRMVNPPPILGEYDDIRVCDGGFEIVRYAMATTAVGRELRETFEPLRCPYGVPGDRLWVRESGWRRPERTPRMMREGADTWPKYLYSADGDVDDDFGREHKWHRRPSVHMPRWASRITLEVMQVRVQRVQDISYADILAEGWDARSSEPVTDGTAGEDARAWFAALWDSIHGTGAWDRNDWVFAVTFRRVQP